MRYGMGGLAALVVVLLLTGATFWRFGGERSAATPQPPQPQAVLAQDTSGDTAPEADVTDSGAWPDGLSVTPNDGSEVCPTTSIGATFPVNGDTSAVALTFDGADVTGQSQITPDGTVTYQPPGLIAGGTHGASISFPDADGVVQTYTWSFDVTGAACQQPPTATQPATAPPAEQPPSGAPPSSAPSAGAPPAGAPPAGAPPAGAPPAQGVPPAGPATGAPTGPALGALPTQGILHIVAEHSWLGPQGDTQRNAITETWLNLSSGEARTTEKDASGNELGSTIRSGQSIIQLIPQEKRAVTTVFPDATMPQLTSIRDTLLGYRAAYEQGQLQFVGEETVDGMTAEHLQAPAQGDSGGLDVWLRKDYGLVLREIAYKPGASHEVAQTHVVTYRQAEVAPTVSPDVFAPTISSDWVQSTSRILTPQTAAAMHDFDLYWLDTQYQGLVLVNLSQETVTLPAGQAPPGAPTGPQTSIVVAYAPAPPAPPTGGGAPPTPTTAAPSGVTLIERQAPAQPAQPPQGQPGRPGQNSGAQGSTGAPPGAEQVTVNGNHGFIFQPPPPPTLQPSQQGQGQPQQGQGQPPQQAGPPPTPPYILDLTIGGTELGIEGPDRGQVMQAAQDLKRLNP